MVYLFCALFILLLLLSWKYILRLEPAGVFAVLWLSMAFFTLLLQDYIDLNFEGCSFLLLGVVFFVIGTISSDYFYNPTPSDYRLELKKKWVRPLLLVLLIGAMVNPIYSIILHGFSLRALLDMREVLEMNKGISEDRYAGAEASNVVNQFFLIFSYAAPVIGGLCYRLVEKWWDKVLCVITLIPCTFIALTQSLKMGMIASFILFFAAYIVSSYTFGLPIRLKGKIILRFALIIAGFLGTLFISMVFRTGEVSEKTILQYKFPTCCHPIPGDDALGYIDNKSQIEIHKRSCPVAAKLKSGFGNRILDVKWDMHKELFFVATIRISGIDRVGMLNDVTQVISAQMNVNIRNLNITCEDGMFDGTLELRVHDRDDVKSIIKNLKQVADLKEISEIT